MVGHWGAKTRKKPNEIRVFLTPLHGDGRGFESLIAHHPLPQHVIQISITPPMGYEDGITTVEQRFDNGSITVEND